MSSWNKEARRWQPPRVQRKLSPIFYQYVKSLDPEKQATSAHLLQDTFLKLLDLLTESDTYIIIGTNKSSTQFSITLKDNDSKEALISVYKENYGELLVELHSEVEAILSQNSEFQEEEEEPF